MSKTIKRLGLLTLCLAVSLSVAAVDLKLEATLYYGLQSCSLRDFNDKVIDAYNSASGDNVSDLSMTEYLQKVDIYLFFNDHWGIGLLAQGNYFEDRHLARLSATESETYGFKSTSVHLGGLYLFNPNQDLRYGLGASIGFFRPVMSYKYENGSSWYKAEYTRRVITSKVFAESSYRIGRDASLTGHLGYNFAYVGTLKDGLGSAFERAGKPVIFDFSGVYFAVGLLCAM